jgi:hypothetical protein
MKWEKFKKLSPEERRQLRTKKSRGKQARERMLSKYNSQLPERDFTKNPEIELAITLITEYFFNDSPTVVRNSILQILMDKAKKYPDTLWGFWNNDNKFISGLIPLMANLAIKGKEYEDELDYILCEENISESTQSEVIKLAADRGTKLTIDALKKRIKGWDK